MITTRVIPCLLLRGSGLVKTVKFKDPTYVGDPRNAVKIFNDKEVDELVILDITASVEGKRPQFDLIHEIVSEAFMPVAYGGGIRTLEDARRMVALGVEKVVLCTSAVENPAFVGQLAAELGNQSVVVCLDVRRSLFGKYELYTRSGQTRGKLDPVRIAREMERAGAGEIIIQSIDRDGAMVGYDLDLVRAVAGAVNIPVVACGGAGNLGHIREARAAGASAVAAGSMFVFQGKHRAVLISYPDQAALRQAISD